MKRVRSTPVPVDPKQIQVLSEIVGRAMLATQLGTQSYGGNRDLMLALGYKAELVFTDFFARYKRQEIAKAVIDRPVKATWQGVLELQESNEPEETEFEKAWRELNRDLGLKSKLSRLDRLTGIGRYGVLLLGFNDISRNEDWIKPLSAGKKQLKYIRPLGESTAEIDSFEDNPGNERYGMPLLYNIQTIDPSTKGSRAVKVHYSRVIHVTDSPLESDVYGTPRLEAIFNRLMDVEKIAGGDAEMFWRGARPGYHGKLDPEYQATPEFKADLQNQLAEFEHNLTRFLINEGIDLESLAQQIADPSTHLDTQLKLISSETGIPIRILTGSERGELASSEDRSEWLSYVQTRREEHAEPCIVRPFVDKLIEYGVLPEPSDDYNVKWSDLFAQSEKMRVEIGKSRANAIREYTSNPMAIEIIPPSVFMEKCLGLTIDEIELVHSMRDDELQEELKKMKDAMDMINPPTPAPEKPKEKSKEQRGEPKQRRRLPSASV
jgi:hypothetical protein